MSAPCPHPEALQALSLAPPSEGQSYSSEYVPLGPKGGYRVAVYRGVDKAWTCRQGCPMTVQKDLLSYRQTGMNEK